jgi:hypothetical protein
VGNISGALTAGSDAVELDAVASEFEGAPACDPGREPVSGEAADGADNRPLPVAVGRNGSVVELATVEAVAGGLSADGVPFEDPSGVGPTSGISAVEVAAISAAEATDCRPVGPSGL